MSDFWDAFTVGADAVIEMMGEVVTIAGQEMMAVVQPAETRPEAVPGGQSAGVTHVLHVSLTDGNALADGDKVVSRALRGAARW